MNLIPKVIYQSWKTKKLNPLMSKNVENLKSLNPEYEYKLYDDSDCRKFLMDNFGVNYADAFDALIPGAFKSDLWRYAILYLNGGVYLDMDIEALCPFRDILNDSDQFVSVADQKNGIDNITGVYQAFIACKPKHPILLYALQLSFSNIATRRLSINSLDITGPTVMGVAFNLYFKNSNTYTAIKSGDYGDGVRLLSMSPKHTFDLQGRVIFNNKFDGYSRGSNNYGLALHYYTDSPWEKSCIIQTLITRFGKYVLIILVILILLAIYMYSKKKRSKLD
jgi:hypothetical protein